MTNTEAFIFKTNDTATAAQAAAALSFVGLDPDADFHAGTGKCQFYEALLSYLDTSVSSITEGGYSVSYDKEAKAATLKRLAQESGCKKLMDLYDPTPVVKNKSYLW